MTKNVFGINFWFLEIFWLDLIFILGAGCARVPVCHVLCQVDGPGQGFGRYEIFVMNYRYRYFGRKRVRYSYHYPILKVTRFRYIVTFESPC